MALTQHGWPKGVTYRQIFSSISLLERMRTRTAGITFSSLRIKLCLPQGAATRRMTHMALFWRRLVVTPLRIRRMRKSAAIALCTILSVGWYGIKQQDEPPCLLLMIGHTLFGFGTTIPRQQDSSPTLSLGLACLLDRRQLWGKSHTT